MWAIIGLGILFLYWVIAPFLPKDKGATPVVIHNNIHIVNNPDQSNNQQSAPSQQEPKHSASEEGLFGGNKIRW